MANKFSNEKGHSKDPSTLSKVGVNRDSGSEMQLKAAARTAEPAENSRSIFKPIFRSPKRSLDDLASITKDLNNTFKSSYALISGAAVFIVDQERGFSDMDLIVPRSQRVVSILEPKLKLNGFEIVLEGNGFVEKIRHTETDMYLELTNTSLSSSNEKIAEKLNSPSISIENFDLGFPTKVLMDNTQEFEINYPNGKINVTSLSPFYQVAVKYNLMRIRGDRVNKDAADIRTLINHYYTSLPDFFTTEEKLISKNHDYIGKEFCDSIYKIMQ